MMFDIFIHLGLHTALSKDWNSLSVFSFNVCHFDIMLWDIPIVSERDLKNKTKPQPPNPLKGLCNSAAQSIAEVYEVQKNFNLAAERRVLHLHCLFYRESLFSAQEKSFVNKILQQKMLQSTYAREENRGQGRQYACMKLRHGKMKWCIWGLLREILSVSMERNHACPHVLSCHPSIGV